MTTLGTSPNGHKPIGEAGRNLYNILQNQQEGQLSADASLLGKAQRQILNRL